MGISRDDWTKALAAAQIDCVDDQEALGAVELMQLWHCSYSAARRRIHRLVAAGVATRTQKYYLETDGRRRPVPAYRLVKKLG